jgi:hypothetical protein
MPSSESRSRSPNGSPPTDRRRGRSSQAGTGFEQIKRHYCGVHAEINPTGIVPLGPDPRGWLTAHGREELVGRPFGDGTTPGPPLEGERVPPIG